MRVAVFSARDYDRDFLEKANEATGGRHLIQFFEIRLGRESARLAAGCDAVCAFVNDQLGREVLELLAGQGIRLVALRSAGFNNVDLEAARDLGIAVARVPAYSPDAVAEHTVAMMLALDRNIHKAYVRVREGNFALEGLLGFNLRGRTVGIVGTGAIGLCVARIMRGFGCEVIAADPAPNDDLDAMGGRYVAMPELLAASDIVSLHCPLTPQTHHLIDHDAVARMKHGAMLINTSRGGVVDTRALIAGLKSGRIGNLGLDVYEEEADLFFENLSDRMIQDDVFARLLTFPNVLVTGHQAFFTHEAMTAIAETTMRNVSAFEETGSPVHPVSVERLA
ncbi:2-hydroxyacid dehydrogenase [Novosphingobium malaysiense]|uniref:2-hydroxyacid dehydrogenase n=1 Tax=Novosphingobium malaysiense TaxID=1348853 RepID=A0A0B1ZW70_9SPHN|nr:2-hydroxyacid dehydrogenase [Novosphingobium malaysiense]KHK93428.1 2-hydroxyacid dehydrogenase [Novosphingobium malaysiense]